MVARKLPNTLPAGWTVNCKVLNSGRKLKYYTDLKSGKKFYSMNEVYRYMKSMIGKGFKIQQLRHCNSQIQPAMVAKDSLDMLPAGWTVNCKVLNSGRKLKYYTDLKTGKKLYSMNEVHRYIKSKNALSFKTRTSCGKRCTGSKKYFHGNKKTNSDIGWLPKGWLIELRQYETGPKIGKEYKVYIDESTGHKCYSRQEVLRFLKKQNDKGQMVRETKKDAVTRSKSCEYTNNSKTKMEEHLDAVNCDTHAPIKKKLRSLRNASSTALSTSPAEMQKLAAHPKNSSDKGTYVARSFTMSDACVNGVQTRGSQRKQQSNLDNGSTLTSTANVINGDIISGGIYEMHTTGKNRWSLPSRFSKRLARLEPELVTDMSSNCYTQAPPAKRSNRVQNVLPLTTIDNLNDQQKICHSLSAAKVDPIPKEENTASTGNSCFVSLNNTKNIRETRLCRRFSKRLAGFEPEVASVPGFSEKVVQGLGKRSCTDQVMSVSASALSGVVLKSGQQQSAHVEQPDLSRCLLNQSNSENGLEFYQRLGLGSNAGNTKSKTRHKVKSTEAKRVAAVEVDVGEVKTRLPTTIQDVQPEMMGTCKDQELQHQMPVWHSWSDPCLEFAFKTLTGEISIEDDLQIESYFNQIKTPAQKSAGINGSLSSPECNPINASQKSSFREQTLADRQSGSAVVCNWINYPQANGGDQAKV